MNEIVTVATITILAVISPGPDFAMITRNSYAFGVRSGLLSALGIACGVQLHVIYTIFGIAILITHSPILFLGMKILGALYLLYLGYQSIKNRNKNIAENKAETLSPSLWGAFCMGFLTNALNPKTMLFVIATFTQIIHSHSSIFENLCYGAFMSLSHLIWFSLVAIFFSSPVIRLRVLAHQHIADLCIGSVLMILGTILMFTNIPSVNIL